MNRPNKINIKPFDIEYFNYLEEWANVTASALMFSYLLNNFDPQHHWIYRSLHCSLPVKMYNLWEPLSKDSELNKLGKNNPIISKIKTHLNDDQNEPWRKIRNSMAHVDGRADTQKKDSIDLLKACIFIGFYIEEASVEYKKHSKNTNYAPIRMMSANNSFNDFKVLQNLWDDMIASINILLSEPLICSDKDALLEIADKTGKYRYDFRVTGDHEKDVMAFYFEQKKIVEEEIQQFDSPVIILSENEK